MVPGIKALLCSIVIMAGIIMAVVPRAGAQDEALAVRPEARQAVLHGEIIDIDRDSITIRDRNNSIRVNIGNLIRQGLGDLDDYYDEGMAVTVEGTMTGKDEIVASRVTRGSRYIEIPPYIVNNPGIIRADDLD